METTSTDRRSISAKRIRKFDSADQFAAVLELCLSHFEEYPDHAPVWATLGRTYVTFARYRDAEEALTKALVLAPKERRHLIYWQFGHLEEARGNRKLAMDWHRKAARLKPEDASSFIYCGSISYSEGKLKQSANYHRRATECNEGMIDEAWLNLGGALLAQGQLEKARNCYQKAITIDPKYRLAKKRLKDVELAIKLRKQP